MILPWYINGIHQASTVVFLWSSKVLWWYCYSKHLKSHGIGITTVIFATLRCISDALCTLDSVSDCLTLLVYKERGEKSKGQRERNQFTLRDICGLEALQGFDGVNYALGLLCLSQSVMLGFDNKVSLLAWDARIRYSLGEGERGACVCVCEHWSDENVHQLKFVIIYSSLCRSKPACCYFYVAYKIWNHRKTNSRKIT